MQTLFFIGHNNIGDALLCNIILTSFYKASPQTKIHLIFKNSFTMKELFPNSPFEFSTICTKFSLEGIFSTIKFYKQILNTTKTETAVISGLLGSSTVQKRLIPLLLWNKLFGRNKIIILHLKPLFNSIPATKHLVNFHLEKLKTAFNCQIPVQLPKIIENIPKTNTIALCIGASRPWKTLPHKKFSTIANFFIKNGYTIKILGGKTEISTAEKIIAQIKNPTSVQNLTGKTTILEFIHNIGSSFLTIANDSSPQHICQVLQIPCTTIWGRWQHSQTVKAYCWQNNLHLNIFNKPYCFQNKKDPIGRNKQLIYLNLQIISAEEIINQTQVFIDKIKP